MSNGIEILIQLCSVPTAPFCEHQVIRYVERLVAARRGLKLSRDSWGNMLIELRGGSRGRAPRWVFTAHMDHPGFRSVKMLDGRTLSAQFHGYVHINFVRGQRVRFFDDGCEIRGKVIDAKPAEHDRLSVPGKVKIQVESEVPAGCPGMFDQGEGRIKGKRFLSRVCDDLAGAAAALAMLDELLANPPAVPVAVLLTRAEEEGFIGAIGASRKPRLLKKTDRVIAIECSAMQSYAPQGKGAIIRVGDRASVFNSSLTYFLTQQAEQLAKKDKRFKFRRALMPGGVCEATIYDIYGFIASSICVPLGNYHNMNHQTRRIEPEYIDVEDWKNMVKLFVKVARTGNEYEPGLAPLRRRVERRFKKLKHLLNSER